MLTQKCPVFILKGLLLVMFRLLADVFAGSLNIRCTDRKRAVSVLPCKRRQSGFLLFNPGAGHPFDFLHPVGLGNGSGQSTCGMEAPCTWTQPRWGWLIVLTGFTQDSG